eukprot:ANDGO_07191.mRNA.1 hypothetical protein
MIDSKKIKRVLVPGIFGSVKRWYANDFRYEKYSRCCMFGNAAHILLLTLISFGLYLSMMFETSWPSSWLVCMGELTSDESACAPYGPPQILEMFGLLLQNRTLALTGTVYVESSFRVQVDSCVGSKCASIMSFDTVSAFVDKLCELKYTYCSEWKTAESSFASARVFFTLGLVLAVMSLATLFYLMVAAVRWACNGSKKTDKDYRRFRAMIRVIAVHAILVLLAIFSVATGFAVMSYGGFDNLGTTRRSDRVSNIKEDAQNYYGFAFGLWPGYAAGILSCFAACLLLCDLLLLVVSVILLRRHPKTGWKQKPDETATALSSLTQSLRPSVPSLNFPEATPEDTETQQKPASPGGVSVHGNVELDSNVHVGSNVSINDRSVPPTNPSSTSSSLQCLHTPPTPTPSDVSSFCTGKQSHEEAP